MEFEEIDGKIERKSQTTFSTYFYPAYFPGIILFRRSIRGDSKERLTNLPIIGTK
jgi:hypothetical protein